MNQPKSSASAAFSKLRESVTARVGLTMIVNSHLAQMRLFMLRQGLEFYPAQDTFGFRKQFISQLVEENEIDMRMEGIIDDFP